jgi:hypothetical protein
MVYCTQGYPIGKGADLFISTWNLHRSPHLWKDPDSFNPDRFTETFSNDAFEGRWAGAVRGGEGETGDTKACVVVLQCTFLVVSRHKATCSGRWERMLPPTQCAISLNCCCHVCVHLQALARELGAKQGSCIRHRSMNVSGDEAGTCHVLRICTCLV